MCSVNSDSGVGVSKILVTPTQLRLRLRTELSTLTDSDSDSDSDSGSATLVNSLTKPAVGGELKFMCFRPVVRALNTLIYLWSPGSPQPRHTRCGPYTVAGTLSLETADSGSSGFGDH